MDRKTRLLDFLTLAVPGLLTLLAVVIMHLVGVRGPSGWSLGMTAVGLAFLGIWLRVYLLRGKSG